MNRPGSASARTRRERELEKARAMGERRKIQSAQRIQHAQAVQLQPDQAVPSLQPSPQSYLSHEDEDHVHSARMYHQQNALSHTRPPPPRVDQLRSKKDEFERIRESQLGFAPSSSSAYPAPVSPSSSSAFFAAFLDPPAAASSASSSSSSSRATKQPPREEMSVARALASQHWQRDGPQRESAPAWANAAHSVARQHHPPHHPSSSASSSSSIAAADSIPFDEQPVRSLAAAASSASIGSSSRRPASSSSSRSSSNPSGRSRYDFEAVLAAQQRARDAQVAKEIAEQEREEALERAKAREKHARLLQPFIVTGAWKRLWASHTHTNACSICLAELSAGQSVIQLPCKHTFHAESCLQPWLQRQNVCPYCRFDLAQMRPASNVQPNDAEEEFTL